MTQKGTRMSEDKSDHTRIEELEQHIKQMKAAFEDNITHAFNG